MFASRALTSVDSANARVVCQFKRHHARGTVPRRNLGSAVVPAPSRVVPNGAAGDCLLVALTRGLSRVDLADLLR